VKDRATEGVSSVGDAIAVRAAYERFPAGVKGAFLLRGADGKPHQVRIQAARAAEIGGSGQEPIVVELAILEAAPTMDTFVPFEVSTLDLLPGWYRLECELIVDAVPSVVHPGSRFLVSWPRSAVRRGSAAIGKKAGGVTIDSLECGGDSVRIAYQASAEPVVKLFMDGNAHAVLEVQHDEAAGKGRVIGYPALRQHARLAIQVEGEKPVEVALP